MRCVLLQAPTPKMPPTQAVLKVLPATTTYPGAQFRLAGDRCNCHAERLSSHVTPTGLLRLLTLQKVQAASVACKHCM